MSGEVPQATNGTFIEKKIDRHEAVKPWVFHFVQGADL